MVNEDLDRDEVWLTEVVDETTHVTIASSINTECIGLLHTHKHTHIDTYIFISPRQSLYQHPGCVYHSNCVTCPCSIFVTASLRSVNFNNNNNNIFIFM